MSLDDLYKAGYKAGSDIADAVNDAVDNNDFSGLASSIRKSVKDVSDSVSQDAHSSSYWYSSGGSYYGKESADKHYGRSSTGAGYGGSGFSENNGNPYQGRPSGTAAGEKSFEGTNRYQNGSSYRENDRNSGSSRFVRYGSRLTPFLQKRPSHQSGLLKILFGVFGTICGTIVLFGNAVLMPFLGLSGGIGFGLLAGAVITAASVYAIISGNRERRLITRYYEYGEALGSAEYIEIRKLARMTHRTADEVLEDIKKLMAKGLLPEARLDEQETTLMLSEEVYEQYEEIKRQVEQQRAEQKEQAQKAEEQDAELPADAREILREGSSYIQMIHRFNDEIPGQEMSDKLDQLESTMNRILEQVRRQPGSAANLHRLMNYYLPTTAKLLDAYVQLDRQDIDSENARSTRKEIEDALDMINDAFGNLLNSLFQDMAWDISSDISVMKTMFAQDGLTGSQMETGGDSSYSTMTKGSGQNVEADEGWREV